MTVACYAIPFEAFCLHNIPNAHVLSCCTSPPLLLQLALSQRTLQGLKKGNYESMKDIQTACIPHLLAGRDLMGAAKTGSGKTLAFLIPAMERLYRLGWNSLDGNSQSISHHTVPACRAER